MKNRANLWSAILFVLCAAVLCVHLVGCGTQTLDGPDGQAESADASEGPDGIHVAESIDLPKVDQPYGSLLASDGTNLYFAYRSNEDEGGLYCTDLSLENTVKLDSGHVQGLCISGNTLFYMKSQGYGLDEPTYFSINLHDRYPLESSQKEYESQRMELDTSGDYTLPYHKHICAPMGDVAYFINFKDKIEEEDAGKNSVPLYGYELATIDHEEQITPTDVTWEHRGTVEGAICAYGDYVFFARPWEREVEDDGVDEGTSVKSYCVPCCYDTKSGAVTVLLRKRSLTTDVYPVNACSGYLLVSSYDDDVCDGSSLYLESLADPNVNVWVKDLVAKADTEKSGQVDEARERERQEELKNEPYGPGTSTLRLSAPDDKSAAYRLVRMDGSTEFLLILGPGEEQDKSFPSGRYTLKVAEGKTWISDEEAFGPSGTYSTTDVFNFEDGGVYKIGGSAIRGDFSKDDASGFVS